MKNLLIFLSVFFTLNAIEIKQLPITFDKTRIDLTKEYIKNHYGIKTNDINIIPKMIVIHHTALNDFKKSYKRFYPSKLLSDRKYILKASNLNVSAHFLVDIDGTIYSLMPETFMARHVIGLNYSSIGIENVGGQRKNDKLNGEHVWFKRVLRRTVWEFRLRKLLNCNSYGSLEKACRVINDLHICYTLTIR